MMRVRRLRGVVVVAALLSLAGCGSSAGFTLEGTTDTCATVGANRVYFNSFDELQNDGSNTVRIVGWRLIGAKNVKPLGVVLVDRGAGPGLSGGDHWPPTRADLGSTRYDWSHRLPIEGAVLPPGSPAYTVFVGLQLSPGADVGGYRQLEITYLPSTDGAPRTVRDEAEVVLSVRACTDDF